MRVAASALFAAMFGAIVVLAIALAAERERADRRMPAPAPSCYCADALTVELMPNPQEIGPLL